MRSTVLLSGVLIAAGIGCSNKGPSTEVTAAVPAQTASVAAAALASTAVVEASSSPAAPPAPRAPIASADGASPGVRVEVTELKRTSGGTVTLRGTMVNDSDTYVSVNLGAPGTEVQLIDPVGKKKYFVARDANSQCICSGVAATTTGGRVNLWAKFPAPPDGVERISIVLPQFSPMDDVPLSR